MGMFLRQDDHKTELQKRLQAELQAKAEQQGRQFDHERPDGVDDSSYIEKTNKSSKLLGVWIILGIIFVIIVLWVAVKSTASGV